MTVEDQIEAYVTGQPEPKRADLRALHDLVLAIIPDGPLWFLDGRDDSGKVVSNPNIGYGRQTMRYAGGKTRAFFQIGVSANTTGISVYIMGLDDKTHLARTYGRAIGKATVSGYCIKFRKLEDVDVAVLEAAIRDGIAATAVPIP
ncbi:MAG TPA: DUF1801 domain-containing protein [Caulobacter sp.]|nr:DUF1801 domain-containing protein [Caulobacter sp.]